MSYSVDLRTRVLAAVDQGMCRRDVVATFQVSEGSIKRWLTRRRTGETLTPQVSSGRRARITPAQYPALVAQLEADPDATLAIHVQQWQACHGVVVSRWAMSRAIRAAGWTRKKVINCSGT